MVPYPAMKDGIILRLFVLTQLRTDGQKSLMQCSSLWRAVMLRAVKTHCMSGNKNVNK